MMFSKSCIIFILVCIIIQYSLSKPTENESVDNRSIASVVWDWLTYPFTWWSSDTDDDTTTTEQWTTSITLTPIGLYDKVEISKRNITVWCNGQTCTTMKCDNLGCLNITCNLYDTDLNGECREYNTIPEETVTYRPTTEQFTKPTTSFIESTTNASTANTILSSQQPDTFNNNQEQNVTVEERPLELEVALSSTIPGTRNDKEKTSNASPSPKNKI